MNAPSPATRHYSAVVVGGGQAGLSASYWLSRAGLDHVVFEKKTTMHKWRDERWDAFCLVTPELAVPAAGPCLRRARSAWVHGEGSDPRLSRPLPPEA